MSKITAAEVNKLRKSTGAGMMDKKCKEKNFKQQGKSIKNFIRIFNKK